MDVDMFVSVVILVMFNLCNAMSFHRSLLLSVRRICSR